MPVESKTFSTLEVEDELLSKEMPEITPRTTDAHESNQKKVILPEEEIILRVSKLSQVSY